MFYEVSETILLILFYHYSRCKITEVDVDKKKWSSSVSAITIKTTKLFIRSDYSKKCCDSLGVWDENQLTDY